jgi:hypothetical protein
MKNIEKLTLIHDVLSTEDAKDILLGLFSSKINFHNIKNWSSQERFAKDDEISQKSIPALKMEMVKLQEILKEAKANNKKLIVNSEINITVLDA